MKHFFIKAWIAVLTALTLVSCAGQGGAGTLSASSTPPATGSLTTVRFGIDATYPPFEEVDYVNGGMKGFDIELIDAIAAREGLKIEFINTGYPHVLAGVAGCQFDGAISAIEATDDLRQQMDFSAPYLSIGQVVVVKSGNITINGPESLKGMTVGAQEGSAGAKEIARIPGARYQAYPTFDLAYQDLINGLIDAVISEKPLALSFVAVQANRLKISGGEFSVVNYEIAICMNNTSLARSIDAGLASVQADGTLDELIKKWLGAP